MNLKSEGLNVGLTITRVLALKKSDFKSKMSNKQATSKADYHYLVSPTKSAKLFQTPIEKMTQ